MPASCGLAISAQFGMGCSDGAAGSNSCSVDAAQQRGAHCTAGSRAYWRARSRARVSNEAQREKAAGRPLLTALFVSV